MREEDKNRTVRGMVMSEVKFLFIYYPSSYLWVSWDGWEKVDVGLNQSPQMQMIDSRIFGDDIFRQQLTNVLY